MRLSPRAERRNPLVPLKPATVPPCVRSRAAQGLTAAAALGLFALQRCEDCGAVQYPPRDACVECLSARLRWRLAQGGGELLSQTLIRHGQELYFRESAPFRAGLVRLDDGPSAIVALHRDCEPAPCRLRLRLALDKAGQALMIGLPEKDTPAMADDPLIRETTCAPRARKVLVTDAKTKLGRTMIEALVAAGADLIWAGFAAPWKPSPHLEALSAFEPVTLVPLDVTDESSVRELAASIGGKVDILINTAEYHRPGTISSHPGVETARAEMETNYFGLLRLAQAFSPALKARAADGVTSACAWVNILSAHALSNDPAHGTFSASKAAATSLAQALRADLQASGVRVLNVFPGPIEEEWNALVPPPKLSPAGLAKAVVDALERGLEDVFPGEVAKDLIARFLENPKALERELAG
ncbi:MAG: SDR family NAD(P)-dependent oxidoreductase [Hyphomicrobiales bacterium]|nr:SDR family NAD(P)-dependent oxidoreductase [Hyphomicrobiales bacterium]